MQADRFIGCRPRRIRARRRGISTRIQAAFGPRTSPVATTSTNDKPGNIIRRPRKRRWCKLNDARTPETFPPGIDHIPNGGLLELLNVNPSRATFRRHLGRLVCGGDAQPAAMRSSAEGRGARIQGGERRRNNDKNEINVPMAVNTLTAPRSVTTVVRAKWI